MTLRLALALALAGTASGLDGEGGGDAALSADTSKCLSKCETYNSCKNSLDSLSCETGCVNQCKCLSSKRRMLNAHKRNCMSMLQAQKKAQAERRQARHAAGLLQTGKKGLFHEGVGSQSDDPAFREFVSVSEAFGAEEKPQPVVPHMLNAHHRQQAQVSFIAARKRALWRRRRAALAQRRPTHEVAAKAGAAKGLAEVISGIDEAKAVKDKKAEPTKAKTTKTEVEAEKKSQALAQVVPPMGKAGASAAKAAGLADVISNIDQARAAKAKEEKPKMKTETVKTEKVRAKKIG